MNLGTVIRRLREEQKLTGVQLAARTGLNQSYLSKLERGKAGYSPEGLARIARELGTTSAAILEESGDGTPRRITAYAIKEMSSEDDYDPAEGVMIPVSDMEVSGGSGRVVPEFTDSKYRLHFTRKWLKEKGSNERDVRVSKVRGESMQPILWDGDNVVLDVSRKAIKNERVFAIAYGGEARVKRLHLLADGRLRIASDNPDKLRFPDEFLAGDDLNRLTIIGQVIHKMGDGGL